MIRMKTKNVKAYVIATILSVVWIGINYYLYFPALNVQSQEFWLWLMVQSVVVNGLYLLCGVVGRSRKKKFKKKVEDNVTYFKGKMGKSQLVALFGIPVVCALVLVIGNLTGAKIFNAKRYANLLKVEERNFIEDIPESENVENIALMDTNSAKIFGERKIGSLSDVVSQYEVEDEYTQINLENKPMKVANLKYASFFKYLSNRKEGIPGYVQVNPVNSEAKYVKLEKGMKYVTSGYFNHNIYRYVQLHNPTKIIEDCYFEVDDQGEPYYICPVMEAKVGLFGGKDVKGAIICSPVSGEMQYYAVSEIPSWVDRVYDGDLLERKFDWYGELANGYVNSIIGQKGCIQTTDDYGYKTIEDDVWVYTGVTSVTGDASNIGFVMINQRTSEARYYRISGAEEYSAMAAAEGEVQEKDYTASFPSLINVEGVPTYIMVLIDNGGLVKMYAMVNVEQYNLVVTAESQEEAFAKYKKLLAKNGQSDSTVQEEKTIQEKEILVSEIQYVTMDGETYVYLKDTEGIVYKQKFAEDEQIVKVSVGDTVFVQYEYEESGICGIITEELRQKATSATQKLTSEADSVQENKTENATKEDVREDIDEETIIEDSEEEVREIEDNRL